MRDAYQLVVDARDARFDGVFFVGITSTRVYCRPACKSRLAYDHHRRFFNSAAAAERAGFRPCLRCRPELAPGRLDAVSQLARDAVQRIAAGALNGRAVATLASELGVSQRRFNAVFRAQYRMPPSALRRGRRVPEQVEGFLRLTLSYRPPLAWEPLLRSLGCEGSRYERSVPIEGQTGLVVVENSAADGHLVVDIADTLLPVLMPLIAGLRRVFDLDAEPAVIGAHLAERGLAELVARWPGVRVPGRFDGLVSPDEFPETDRR